MNEHERLEDHRVARALRGLARDVELAPGSELAVVGRGRRRIARRRRGVALALTAVVGGGTVVVVQQLARTGDSAIVTEEGVVTGITSVPNTTVPGAPTVPPVPPAIASEDVQPANPIDPFMEWNVVEPDTAEAVAYAHAAGSSKVPGIVLSSSPGVSDQSEPMWWRSEDGVSWQPFELDVPVGFPHSVVFAEAAMYSVGTAPGIAATEPNPLKLGVSADDGATWDLVDLGIDTHAGNELPFVKRVLAWAQTVPVDDGVVVLVQRMPQLDMAAVNELVGVDPNVALSSSPAGVKVPVDPTCRDVAGPVPTTVVYTGDTIPPTVPASSMPSAVPAPQPLPETCETRLMAWEDIGVPAETVEVVFHPRWSAHHVVDAVATEVEIPVPIARMGGMYTDGWGGGRTPLFYVPSDDGVTQRAFRFEAGAFVETEGQDPSGGYPIGANDTTEFLQSYKPSSFDGRFDQFMAPVFGATDEVGQIRYADWSGLFSPMQVTSYQQMTVTAAGLVSVGQLFADPIAEKGGASVTVEGVTLSRASMMAPIEVRAEATGELVDPATITFDDMVDGAMVVPVGEESVRIDQNRLGPIAWEVPIDYQNPEWTVAMSANGVDVSVESLADLLGVSDADISSVPRISTDGTRTIIAVTMKEQNADGVPLQMVLVGTPKG